jgi:hypothetical protein
MRFLSVSLALLGIQQAIASEQKAARTLSNDEVLEYLVAHPNALPKNARIVLEERLKNMPSNLQKRNPQSSIMVATLGALQNTLDSLGRTLPKATVPDVQVTNSTRFPGAIHKKIRFGPYRIPPTSEKNVEFHMLNQKGMTNTLKFGAQKPCGKECMMLAMGAGLEYADGKKVPNNPSGAWLHHVVLINAGMQVKDATCFGMVETVFESGNERSDFPFYVPQSGVKSGYHVRNSDVFVINTELMNLEDNEKWAWLTMEYDYLEGFKPDWKEGKVVWMSVGPDRCTGDFKNPFGATNLTRTQQPTRDKFEEYSVPWTAPKNGLIIGANSHLHDGGVDTKVYLEDRHICTSAAKYSTGGGHSHGMKKRQMGGAASGDHISEQVACVFDKPMPISKGQSMFIKCDYDFTKHEGMKNAKGELDEIMGITGTLVAFDYDYWQAKKRSLDS